MKYFAGAFLLIAASPLAIADDDAYDTDKIEFVVGNVVFVTLHELTHLVIEDFDVPVLGNGEDAADSLAAVTLIQLDRARPERDFRFIRMLLTAADANRILWQRGLEQDNPAVYLARHPLSAQRAARIACLASGSDPELLEPLPDIVGLPAFRADWCDEEFGDAEKAWLWVRDSFVRESSGTASEHDFIYGTTREPRNEAVREWLVQNEALERTLAYVGRTMLLPDAITVRTIVPVEHTDLILQLLDALFGRQLIEGVDELITENEFACIAIPVRIR